MAKKSSLNGVMLIFSVLAAVVVFFLGEILLRFLSGIPFILQCAIYLMFVTVVIFLAIFLSEKISSGYYIPRGRVTFAGTCAKAAAILVPCAFALGLLTQLIYGFAGATHTVVGVREGGIAYRSHYIFESEEMHDFLLVGRHCGHSAFTSTNPISTSAIPSLQHLHFGGSGRMAAGMGMASSIPGFDLGLNMQEFYAATYAGQGENPTEFDSFVAQMFNPNFSISEANRDIFLSVLQNGFNNGLASVAMPSPITRITTEVGIFDGAGYAGDAGKIDILFDIETYDGSHLYFQAIGCTPGNDPLIADTFGHGFIHGGFANRPLGEINIYEAHRPHLLLEHTGPASDSPVRIAVQSVLLSLWGIFVGIAVVIFLNNNKLFTSFLIPRIIVSIVVSVAFAVVITFVDLGNLDVGLFARALFALGVCLLYLPTFSWGNTITQNRGPASPAADSGW